MDPAPTGVTAGLFVVTVTAHTEEVRMTPEQLDIVATTAADIAAEPARFADAFYDRLFEISPDARELFPDDMGVQKAKLVDEVEFLAAAAKDLDAFVARAADLGARHHQYGVRVEHYPGVELALVAGIEAVLGGAATVEVHEAWSRLYRLIAETMIEGASHDLFASP